MRPTHRIIIAIAALVMAGMTLYPPWTTRWKADAGDWVRYGFLFAQQEDSRKVDYNRLFAQWLAIVSVAGGILLATSARRTPT